MSKSMTNDLFRELTSLAREFVDSNCAESLISASCANSSTTADEVESRHLPWILLALAENRDLLGRLQIHEFTQMMKKFITLSVRHEDESNMGVQKLAH